VKLREAASHGRTIFEYARHSKGSADYEALAREVAGIATPRVAVESAGTGEEFAGAPAAALAGALAGDPAQIDAVLARARERDARPITFSVYAPHASTAELAVGWNGDSEPRTPLVPDLSTGVWSAQVLVPPGRHHYYFVVDGVRIPDPANARVAVGPGGERSSVIDEGESWSADDDE
jgi:hypothetical protein